MTSRVFAWITGCLTIVAASSSSVGGRLLPPETQATSTTIDRYCVGCHNERTKTAGLALDTLDMARAGEHAQVWEKVIKKLRGRMMPPPGRPRPDENAYDAVVSDLETLLDRAAAANPN